MVEHVAEWLGAYLDGELHGLRLRQVETHLEKCAACRSELDNLRSLSILLQEPIPAGAFLPAERFISQLTLRLPRQPVTLQNRKSPSLIWWLAPTALVGLWFFVLTLISLSGAVSLAARSGLLENGTAWLSSAPQHTGMYNSIMEVFGSRMGADTQSILSLSDRVARLGGSLFSQFLWQAGIALLYWTWMAAWWLRSRWQPVFGMPAHP